MAVTTLDKSSFEQLPNEVLLLIAENLNDRELFQLSCTSQRFRKFLQQPGLISKALYKSLKKNFNKLQFAKVILFMRFSENENLFAEFNIFDIINPIDQESAKNYILKELPKKAFSSDIEIFLRLNILDMLEYRTLIEDKATIVSRLLSDNSSRYLCQLQVLMKNINDCLKSEISKNVIKKNIKRFRPASFNIKIFVSEMYLEMLYDFVGGDIFQSNIAINKATLDLFIQRLPKKIISSKKFICEIVNIHLDNERIAQRNYAEPRNEIRSNMLALSYNNKKLKNYHFIDGAYYFQLFYLSSGSLSFFEAVNLVHSKTSLNWHGALNYLLTFSLGYNTSLIGYHIDSEELDILKKILFDSKDPKRGSRLGHS